MARFRGQYRIQSARLPGWDYATAGYYFVTICIRDRRQDFGEIVDSTLRLSSLGAVAAQFWREIPQHFPHVELDASVIMPDHVHGILALRARSDGEDGETPPSIVVETPPPIVETQHAASLRWVALPHSGSLSVIVRSYKSAVTRWAGMNGYSEFAWQSRFYDRILRDDASLKAVREYILANPLLWQSGEDNHSF